MIVKYFILKLSFVNIVLNNLQISINQNDLIKYDINKKYGLL